MGEIIKAERNKRVLERLAEEFGEDFLKVNKGSGIIGLYGTDENILAIFESKLRDYFLLTGKRVPVVVGEGFYNIDVGFFLHAGYFRGINKDINIVLQKT